MAWQIVGKAWDIQFTKDVGMTPCAVKIVLMRIVDRSSNDGKFECFPSYNTLAKDCCMSRSTAQKAVDVLIEQGYITKTTRERPREQQKRNSKTGALMKHSNLYKVNQNSIVTKTPVPQDGIGIPQDGIGVDREAVSNLSSINPSTNPKDYNNPSKEELQILNNIASAKLPVFPHLGNEFGEMFLSLNKERRQFVINCYTEFHHLASELKYIDHTWNPYNGLEILAENFERILWLYENTDSVSFEGFIRNRYKARNIEKNKKKVNLNWLLWSNDEDATGYDLVETILYEGDDFDYENY